MSTTDIPTPDQASVDGSELQQPACIHSEKFGVDIWIVPKRTAENRIEFTAKTIDALSRSLDALGGRVTSLTTRDGHVLEPTAEWKARAREHALRDLKIHYDIVLDREEALRRRLEDPSLANVERGRLMVKLEVEVSDRMRVLAEIRAHGHEPTIEDVAQGFGSACGAFGPRGLGSVDEAAPAPPVRARGTSMPSLDDARRLLREEAGS